MTTGRDALTVLDCTFRDGGYYNDWDFPPDLVGEYLSAVTTAGIDAVEIGFRFTPKERFYGAFAYSTDAMLATLPLPAGVTLGVMCNAKDLLVYPGGGEAAVEALFAPAGDSPLELVRVAAHFAEAPKLGPALARLKAKGYAVGLNLMQAGGKTAEELGRLAQTASGWGCVDVLYFGDSLGSMDPPMIAATIAALRRGWAGPVGVHTHNNMGLGLANSLAAIAAGATWIDGTITGMGRGAGNTRMEFLLLELARKGLARVRPEALFRLVCERFEPMQARYGWGPNLFYYLAGLYGIHPTYVQQMSADGRYEAPDILAVIEALRRSGGASFSGDSLRNAVAASYREPAGAWSAAGWADGRPLLAVAAGPGAARHREALLAYIRRADPVVVALNHVPTLPPEAVTAYAACHPTRLLSNAPLYRRLGRPVILPARGAPAGVVEALAGVEVLDYGMAVAEGRFEVGATGCTVPAPLVAAYVLALAAAAGARKVLLAGFDGYGANDPRNQEMAEVIALFRKAAPGLPLAAVTPSAHRLAQSSIYLPEP
ncbi:MAG: aldolase catalytic domain-containing protein [Proteobacteria bacterium]|nr:aldolase catalytic domain-containing protein [Pseudomonadota bacterium]